MSCSFALSSTTSPSPEPRSSHVAVVHEENLYLYGGWDSKNKQLTQHIWVLASVTNTWTQHNTTGETPTHTISSTATIITNTNNNIPQLVLFGGYDDDGNYSNDIHILDMKKFHWTKPATKGKKPKERAGHVQWSTPTEIVVFAGFACGGVGYFNDIHRLDIASMTWNEPPTFGEPPSPRRGCSYAKKGDEGFVFGGEDGGNNLQDLYAFSLITNSWALLNTHGQVPSVRHSATMNTVRGDLFICGGDDGRDVLSDCWVFNTGKGVWRKLGRFDGRFIHTACELGDKILVYGGNNTKGESLSSLGEISFA